MSTKHLVRSTNQHRAVAWCGCRESLAAMTCDTSKVMCVQCIIEERVYQGNVMRRSVGATRRAAEHGQLVPG